jgi:mannose-1-phosphate guanylyltransferase
VSEGVWADLGTPERFLEGHRLALSGALAWPTLDDLPADRDGVRRAADVEVDASAVLRGPVLLGPGVRVGASAVLGPNVSLGAGTVVGAGSELADTVTFADVEVGLGVRADGLLAGVGTRIGEGSELGREVVLGDGEAVAPHTSVPAGTRQPQPASS